ncbi:hypothetical protein CDIK_1896 [Cucumispora dikerogammari]|nr:hypothetical protein CDIK_1896 [Cucumispora dikerogammari]
MHVHRRQSRSPAEQRANILAPTVRGRSITLIMSISSSSIIFPKVITNSTVNADIFINYFEQLCNCLKNNLQRNNVCLIMDNARIYKAAEIARIISEYSYTYKFLSPYSYMLNPVENSFLKIKGSVRSHLVLGEKGSLAKIIYIEISTITQNDCAGYFRYMFRHIINCAAENTYSLI